jgi:hypothetical protein
LWAFGIFYRHLIYFSRFGMLYQEKSGNPGLKKQLPTCGTVRGVQTGALRNALFLSNLLLAK